VFVSMVVLIHMRTLRLAIFLFLCFQFPLAQNLIPDSSFESNKAIPTDFSGIGNSNSWSRPSMGTTDLFCVYDRKKKKYSFVGVPQNAMGYQFAHSGSCYAGFFLFSHGDYREYLQTPLTAPLEKGKTYFLSFYLSLADFSQTYIDQLGFCFLPKEEHYETADVLNQLEPAYIKLDKVKGDTMLWHRLTARYKATGEEKYLLIGSFQVNKVKRTKFRFPKELRSPINKKAGRDAYYFIDDVSLVEWINPTEDPNMDTKTGRDTMITEKPLVIRNLLFKSGETVIEESSYPALDELIVFLQKDTSLKLRILGHTDDMGGSEKNQRLSELRAAAVALFLINKGVAKERISAIGYGDTQPLVPNYTEENRTLNRRVEVSYYK